MRRTFIRALAWIGLTAPPPLHQSIAPHMGMRIMLLSAQFPFDKLARQ
jgi:hypothetical protein